jgi:alpha-2-macroglobulin
MGFVVQRVYEAVDDPADVRLDENGVWHIRAGARVRVRVTMVADSRRYHVALVDPLPAGLEILNPDLAVTGSTPPDPDAAEPSSRGWWWWWAWYQHENLRDERAEAFTPYLWDGVHEYTYIARATTPGTFVVPPAKAEEMYSPEVFGRSSSNLVIIK